jgi:hypothetical protein
MIAANNLKSSKNLCDVSLGIQRRIQTAIKCFFGLCKHLRSSHLSRQTKFTIHKTMIRPVLLYGSETWVFSVLQTICDPKIENGIYKRKCNHKLDNEFNSPNALNVTSTSRLR